MLTGTRILFFCTMLFGTLQGASLPTAHQPLRYRCIFKKNTSHDNHRCLLLPTIKAVITQCPDVAFIAALTKDGLTTPPPTDVLSAHISFRMLEHAHSYHHDFLLNEAIEASLSPFDDIIKFAMRRDMMHYITHNTLHDQHLEEKASKALEELKESKRKTRRHTP